ncbi:MAG: hypothetical protein SVU32_04690 [Candidatus Nanohaloarchaea archaeon]|nr:hypothetical protein [Candidatus Nanohaloarchaea archaeon]
MAQTTAEPDTEQGSDLTAEEKEKLREKREELKKARKKMNEASQHLREAAEKSVAEDADVSGEK